MNQLPTSWEEVCEKKGIDPIKNLPDLSAIPEEYRAPIMSVYRLMVARDAITESHVPDWNDYDELKYYPWFDMEKTKSNPSGFGLLVVGFAYASSSVGSRLSFRNKREARHAATHFSEDYKNFFVIPE